MATIQRTFKDPALQNPLKYLGYDSIPVEIEDSGNSENYFNISGLNTELHVGKNVFYIKPDAETLSRHAEIGIELLDTDGDLIPISLLDNRRSDGSIGVVINIDESRSKGSGQLTIVSVARGRVVGGRLQAVQNPNTFNIRWVKRLYINRDARNTSEITYIRQPKIEVSELKLPYYSSHFNTLLTSSLSAALTDANPIIEQELTCSIYQLSSSYNTDAKLKYEKVGEQVYLELSASDFGGLVPDMENGTVFFEASNIQDLSPPADNINTLVEDGDKFDDIASEGSYFTSILQVLSPSRILVSSPHTTFHGQGQTVHEVMHQDFEPSDFTLTWAMPPYSHSRYPEPEPNRESDDPTDPESKYLTSYAGIIVDDLDPYSGEVHKIKTYIRAESRPDDYVLCSDLVVEAQEMLIVSESPHYNKNRFKNIPCGKFDSANSSTDVDDVLYFGNYWTASAIGVSAPSLSVVSESRSTPTFGTSANEVYDFVPMRPSLRVGTLGESSVLDDNVTLSEVEVPTAFNLNSNVSASFRQDKLYVLEVSAYVKGTDLVQEEAGIGTGKLESSITPFQVSGGKFLTPPRCDIFAFGEAFQDDTNRIGKGKLLGEINQVGQPEGRVVDVKKVGGYTGVDNVLEVNFRFPFKADADAVGDFRFEIERGLWYFQEISVKPYHRDGVNPHNYNYLVPLPRGLSNPDRKDVFDFMFEFYNIEGHMCAEKIYIDNLCMDNEWTIAPTNLITDVIDSEDGEITFNGPIIFNEITNVTQSIEYNSTMSVTQTFGDIMLYNTSSQEVGHVEIGCGLGFMDKDNCCCHLHADTNVYIFIDNTSLKITGTAAETPAIFTRYVITKFEKDMRERYPYWKGNIYVGVGTPYDTNERWLSWMSWPAVGNQNQTGLGTGITGSMSSVKWQGTSATNENSEVNGTFASSDNFHAYGYSASAYYLENSPIAKGEPDKNAIVFAIVDETNNSYHGNTALVGTAADFNEQPTDNYKRDYGLFVGKAFPAYDCFSVFFYALPSSQGISAGARQEFALHSYAAIETSAVSEADFISFSPTSANLNAITGSNPYAHGSSSVGNVSPHYQGGIYGLKSQSINEKHDFAGGVAGWYNNLSFPVAQTTINKSGSWAQGQATFSGDLFKYIDGNSLGVKVDAKTICINDANELFATNTGSFTGSFTGEITGDTTINFNGPFIIGGGINFWTIEGDFHVGGNEYNYYGGNNTFTSFTSSHYHLEQITQSLNVTNTYGDVLMYNSQSEEIGAIALGCGLGFMDKDNCCCHLHGDTNIYIFIDNTSMNLLSSNPHGGAAAKYTPALLARWVIPKFEKDMRERYPYWKGNIYVGQGGQGPGPGTLPAERWLSWMSWPAVGNQNQFGPGSGITGSLSSVQWPAYPAGTAQNDESTGAYIGSDDFAAYGYSASAYYLENSPIMQRGVPDSNIIVFAMVDETDPGTNTNNGGGAGNGYHYRHNDNSTNNNGSNLTGTAADFTNHLTSHYKADYGLFVGKAYPSYDCFSGYVYAIPSSNQTTHPARQHFALHAAAAIATSAVSVADLINITPTGGDLSALTIVNPYAHGSASVGINSPHYQGGIYGLASQSINEKHDFPQGILGWVSESLAFPISVSNLNKSGSWLRGQASFSADLFEFVDGDSIGVRVDGTTICINESNELFATNSGSYSGSFTGEITGDTILNIDNGITINGGINTYIVGDTFIIGGSNITVFNGDVTHITNLTSSNLLVDDVNITSITASSAIISDGQFSGSFTGSFDGDASLTGSFSGDATLTGSFTGSFDGDARLTGSFSGAFSGDLFGTASYGRDNDWYAFDGATIDSEPTIAGNIYHTGKVGIGDFSGVADTPAKLTVLGDISASGTIYGREFHTQFVSSSIIHMSGSTKFGDTTDDLHQYTGSLQLSHSVMSVFTGSGKFAFGVDHDLKRFDNDSTRIAQFYSGSTTGVTLNVTNWETASAFIEAGGTIGGSSPNKRGPRATLSVNALNSRANYGFGGTRGTAGGSISYHPDTFEGNTNQDDLGDGGDVDSLGRRLLQEVLQISTGGNPQGAINIHARGDRGQQIRFFVGGDDARNTGGKTVETQRMTIINEGLVGIGTHNPQRRLHISESGHTYAGSKGLVPLRVNNFTEGSSQHVLTWDENTGDVYKKAISDLPSGDGGISTFIIGSTFVIGPHNTFINSVSIFANISSSGNISMSNDDGIHIFGGSTTFNSITASSANISDGQFSGSFTGSFDGDARLTGSFSGAFSGDIFGTASYGRDNDWYAQGGATIASEPTIGGKIYHTGKVGVGDFSSDDILHKLAVEGTTKLGNNVDNDHNITGSLQVKHDHNSIFTGSGKFGFGIEHSDALFTEDSSRLAQFYSGSKTAVVVNITNWESASAYTATGADTNGPRAVLSINARNSRANYGLGGTRGIAGGSISYLPDTYEGNTNGDGLGDGGDTDSLGRRLLQEVLHIATGGNPQGSINIHARGDRGQQIRFFTGNDDARNTGGTSTVTQRMTIISEGLIGIGTHNPQRRLHISEPGNELHNKNYVPLRVNNFTEGTGQHALIWDENTGDVYRISLEELTAIGGDSGVGTLTVGSTFVIGPFNTFINGANFFGNITASSNISASALDGVHIFGGSATFNSITSSNAIMTGSFSGSFDGDARLTGSFSGAFSGDIFGTASYGRDNDWYAQGGSTIASEPTLTGKIYHTGKVGVGDFSSDDILHQFAVEGTTKLGNNVDNDHNITGSLQVKHDHNSIFSGSGKLGFGIEHTNALFTEDSSRLVQFYSGSKTSVVVNVTNWETASAYTATGADTNGPRAVFSVNARNSRANYGLGGTRGIAGGSIGYHPDTYEGNTNGDGLGDGGDTDSLGRRLLQEVLHIATGGNPQGSINIHARGDRGQQIRFFTGNDDARNTGGISTVTQRMTIISEGLIGIGTHDPQRRLHISEPGNELNNGNYVPLRVNNFTEGTGQHALIWDETTGDVYRKSLEELTAIGGDSGVGTLAVGSTFVIGPFNTFINGANFFGNITASNNVSASALDGVHIFGGSATFNSITSSNVIMTGSFSGSFDGDGRFTGSFSGSGFISSASEAACAIQIKTKASNANTTHYPLLGTAIADGLACTDVVEDPGFTYNPSSNTLSVANFAGTATNATNVAVTNDTADAYHPITFIDDTTPDGSVEALKANANITVNPGDASLTLAQITASGNISTSANLYFTNAFGADAVFHDNDANTGMLFSSDTITFKENGQQSAKFGTTSGNSIGNPLYKTDITGSTITLGINASQHTTASSDLWLNKDNSQLLFGADKDIILKHKADQGLTISTLEGNLGAGSAESASSLLGLTLHNNTTTIANGDYIGGLFYTANTTPAGEGDSDQVAGDSQTFVSLIGQVSSTANNREAGNFYINLMQQGVDAGDAADQPAVSMIGSSNMITNHMGTKHEQLTTLSSSNHFPLILSSLKNFTHQHYLVWDENTGYVSSKQLRDVGSQNTDNGIGTAVIGTTFQVSTVPTMTNNGTYILGGGKTGIGSKNYSIGGQTFKGSQLLSTIQGGFVIGPSVTINQPVYVTNNINTTGALNVGLDITTRNITASGDVSIAGVLEASEKSFVIPHPTQKGKKLVYGVLEGPEHAVYVRGRVNNECIDLPEEWTGLVEEDSISVQLTPIGKHQNLYVEKVSNTQVHIKNSNLISKSIDAFYFVQGTRKDINPLKTIRDA